MTEQVNRHNGAVIKTLLISDLVDSTKMTEALGDKRTFEIFGLHDRIARDLLKKFDGQEIDKTDGFLFLFERPIDAVGCVLDVIPPVAAPCVSSPDTISPRVPSTVTSCELLRSRVALPVPTTQGIRSSRLTIAA